MSENNNSLITKLTSNCCPYCNRQYSRKDNLNRHLKICKLRDEVINDKSDTISSDSDDTTSSKEVYTRDEVLNVTKTKTIHFKDAQNQTIQETSRTIV